MSESLDQTEVVIDQDWQPEARTAYRVLQRSPFVRSISRTATTVSVTLQGIEDPAGSGQFVLPRAEYREFVDVLSYINTLVLALPGTENVTVDFSGFTHTNNCLKAARIVGLMHGGPVCINTPQAEIAVSEETADTRVSLGAAGVLTESGR
jgi:hypothetical protein